MWIVVKFCVFLEEVVCFVELDDLDRLGNSGILRLVEFVEN